MTKWGGRRAQRWSRDVLARHGRICELRLSGCTAVATEADHIIAVSIRPDLAYDPDNGRPACRHCNASRGAGRQASALVVDERAFFERGRSSR